MSPHDTQQQGEAIATKLAHTYPDLPVRFLSFDTSNTEHLAWDDLLIVPFGSDPLPDHFRPTIQGEIQVAMEQKRVCRILPISTRMDTPIPPTPLNEVKALPCIDFLDPAGKDLPLTDYFYRSLNHRRQNVPRRQRYK